MASVRIHSYCRCGDFRRRIRERAGFEYVQGEETEDGVRYVGVDGDLLIAEDGVVIRRGGKGNLFTLSIRGDLSSEP